MTALDQLDLTSQQAQCLSNAGIEKVEDITDEALEKIDGRMSKGIRQRLDSFAIREGFHEQEPDKVDEDVEPQLNYRGLTFGERLASIREEREYVRKKKTEDGTPYETALKFEELLEEVRPMFIRWGISWHTLEARVEATRHHYSEGGIIVFEDLITYVFRFQCVEADAGGQSSYRDITIPARSLDVFNPNDFLASGNYQGDKGPGKSHTYAQKYAIRTILNLTAGDDPDFTPITNNIRQLSQRQVLIDRLRNAIGENAGEVIKGLIAKLNDKYQQTAEDVLDVPDDSLQGWIDHFEAKAQKEESNEQSE